MTDESKNPFEKKNKKSEVGQKGIQYMNESRGADFGEVVNREMS